MPISQATKMVNGRVSERTADAAGRVLRDNGLTVSAFIRNSLEYVAAKREVPDCGFALDERKPDLSIIRNLIGKLESKPMPGKADFAGMADEQMVERIRMERYGY